MAAAPPTDLVIRYPALTQWWADRLAGAIATCTPYSIDPNQAIALPPFSWNTHQWDVLASPLPLRLARTWGRSPQAVGDSLIEALTDTGAKQALQPHLWMHPEGWLYAQFPGAAWATWLQILMASIPRLDRVDVPAITSGISTHPTLFQAQYAHARSCSLLRLAQQERLIRLSEADSPRANWIWPHPVPWQTPAGHLYAQTEAEQQLLNALMQFPQSLSAQKTLYGHPHAPLSQPCTQLTRPLSETTLQRQAQHWSALFLSLYSQCRMFGDTAPELAQSRLALVFLTRRILAFILQTLLQMEAPTAL
ncbi:MAG: DALR anticodon-binding domain-containing protein [Thermosynechococcaceae cyanobacterium]